MEFIGGRRRDSKHFEEFWKLINYSVRYSHLNVKLVFKFQIPVGILLFISYFLNFATNNIPNPIFNNF